MAVPHEIMCPNCKKKFELSEALGAEFQSKVREELNAELKKKEDDFKKQLAVAELDKKEIAKTAELEKQELKVKLEKELSEKMKSKFALESQDLKNQIEEQRKSAEESKQKELALLKKQRELESKQKDLDLENERKLAEVRQQIASEAKMQSDQENSLKLAEKDKQLTDLQKKVEELNRKSQVGSQQLQGEVLEIQIETLIRELCPEDEITEVKKGARGADITQGVQFQSGRKAGKVLYECKQTSEWGASWPSKLKDDMRESASDVGVIVSSILPKEVRFMGYYEGVWVCAPTMLRPLVLLIREGLIKAARAELAAATPQDQKDFLFKYMTSPKFAQKIQAMCELTASMRETLESEKRATLKNQKKREIEIEGIEMQMANMYGEIEGLVGRALPRVELLELSSKSE